MRRSAAPAKNLSRVISLREPQDLGRSLGSQLRCLAQPCPILVADVSLAVAGIRQRRDGGPARQARGRGELARVKHARQPCVAQREPLRPSQVGTAPASTGGPWSATAQSSPHGWRSARRPCLPVQEQHRLRSATPTAATTTSKLTRTALSNVVTQAADQRKRASGPRQFPSESGR